MMDASEKKRRAAGKAVELIESGMVVGLGTGSTAAEFIRLLGAEVAKGLNIKAIPTSDATAALAGEVGIPLVDFDDYPEIDITVDGADEIDDELRLIKGGGGALLREKIVASASEQVVIIADDTKRVARLGRFPLPVEVVPFGLKATMAMIEVLAEDAGVKGSITLRLGQDGKAFVTDTGHHIVDCAFGAINDPDLLADLLPIAPGVVEHGLFLDLADVAIIAGDGGLTLLEPTDDDA
jgi:ribose 5-phosphate isomerase A